MPYVFRMRLILSTTLLLIAFASQAADVYRYVDERGNAVFTDAPHKGAEKIHVEAAPSTRVVVPILPATAAPAPSPAADKPGMEPFAGYQDLRITQPAPNEPLLNTAGDVDVSLTLHPALRADLGHGLSVLLDGQPVAQNSSRLNVALNNVDRGEHVIEAFVSDSNGQMLIHAAPVRFSLQRPSLLMPGRQPQSLPPIPPPR